MVYGPDRIQVPLPVRPRVSFLASPVLNLGERVGNLYLADKEGEEEFTSFDEETLGDVCFPGGDGHIQRAQIPGGAAGQTDLETLIDTSPVGVVVFDAKTGRPSRSTGKRQES